MMHLIQHLGVTIPIVQAPMAGVSTPDLAAAVSNAGGLGSIGIGPTDAASARAMIDTTRARTDRAFNVNVFVHQSAQADAAREARWLEAMRPLFVRYGAEPPDALRTIYPALPMTTTCSRCWWIPRQRSSAFTSGFPPPIALPR